MYWWENINWYQEQCFGPCSRLLQITITLNYTHAASCVSARFIPQNNNNIQQQSNKLWILTKYPQQTPPTVFCSGADREFPKFLRANAAPRKKQMASTEDRRTVSLQAKEAVVHKGWNVGTLVDDVMSQVSDGYDIFVSH